MAEGFPANRREAILVFHFADRVKAELLLASRLLNAVIPYGGAGTGRGRPALGRISSKVWSRRSTWLRPRSATPK